MKSIFASVYSRTFGSSVNRCANQIYSPCAQRCKFTDPVSSPAVQLSDIFLNQSRHAESILFLMIAAASAVGICGSCTEAVTSKHTQFLHTWPAPAYGLSEHVVTMHSVLLHSYRARNLGRDRDFRGSGRHPEYQIRPQAGIFIKSSASCPARRT